MATGMVSGEHTYHYRTRCATWECVATLLAQHGPAETLARVQAAWEFAVAAHGEQCRPDGRPFATHLAETLELLIVGGGITDEEMLTAGCLHDIVEDTSIGPETLHQRFGAGVAEIIRWLTIPPVREGETREQVRAEALKNVARAPAPVRLLKLADRLSTVQQIDNHPILERQRQRFLETKTYLMPLAADFPWFAEQFALWHEAFVHLEESGAQ
jgi:guanosine-3',5'-bis(diphosphate) 3'-pyrophosphohydrolase